MPNSSEMVITNHGLCLKFKTGVKPSKSFMDHAIEEHQKRIGGQCQPVAISKREFDRLLWKI